MLLLVLAGFVAAGAGYLYLKSYDRALDPQSSDQITFQVGKGSGTKAIAAKLEREGLIDSAFFFRQKSRLLGYDGLYQAGTFLLSPAMTTEEIMVALLHARGEVVRFTIPEGYTLQQTASALAQEGLVDEATFLKVAAETPFDYYFLPGLEAGPHRLEGFLFPDTYEIYKDADERAILEKMLDRFDQIFTEAYVQRADEMGRSLLEIVTIASLVEKETRSPQERERVAGVLYNRLALPMRLRFCSTIQYLLGEPKERLLNKDLEIDSPYNTYKYDGLPPGPIASPGLACIQAALYPEEHDYLYFVLEAYGAKAHRFSETEAEFYRHKAIYDSTLP